MMFLMAGTALSPAGKEPLDEVQSIHGVPSWVRHSAIMAAAKLYGRGHKRAKIAKALESRLLTPAERKKSADERHRKAKGRLFRMEQSQYFRDLIYEAALEKLDGESPAILAGVANKARAGRVDAAKFALELTGRYIPKSDNAPTSVVVSLETIPRPHREMYDVDLDAEEEE